MAEQNAGGAAAGGEAGAAAAKVDAGAGAAAGSGGGTGGTIAGGAGGAGGDGGTNGAAAGGAAGGAGDGSASKPYWPDDWRANLAGNDEKLAKRLERFSTPAEILKSFRALEQKQSSGEFKRTLAADATPEEATQWRKENGIPEKPDGYELKLSQGRVIGEADKPQVDKFLQGMHAKNASPELVNSALDAYYEAQETAIAQREDADTLLKQKNEDTLRVEWGSDFRRNLNMIRGLFAGAPDGFADKIFSARFPDGTPVGSDMDALRYFANLGRELNPAGAVVPGAGANAGAAIADEIGQIEKTMRDNPDQYWKGESGEKMQARYRELLGVRDKLAKAA